VDAKPGWSPWLRATRRMREWRWPWNTRCACRMRAREHLGTVNGTLRVSGIERVEDLRTVNGNIEVYEGGGSVHAHTTNGNVHLELLHVPDKNGAIAETTNGSLLLAVPADTHADLETRCLNGNFFSELPVTFESTLKPREMHGRLGRAAHRSGCIR